MTNLDIASYELLVAKHFEEKLEFSFQNAGAIHARIIAKHIFLSAEKSVRILSDKLSPTVKEDGENAVEVYQWSELIIASLMFLLADTSRELKILVHEPVGKQNPLLNRIKNMTESNRYEIKLIDRSITRDANFMTGDEVSFRAEQNGMGQYGALACANAPSKVKNLNAQFDEWFHLASRTPS